MSRILPLLVIAAAVQPVAAGVLPQLNAQPWIGCYAGYERRDFRFSVNAEGEGVLAPMGEKGALMSLRFALKVQPVVEEVMPDGKVFAKIPLKDGWEAVSPASADPAKLTFRGTVKGGARFEVTLEFDGNEIHAGGRLLDAGATKNPLRFVLRFQVPDVYYYEKDAEKLADKVKKDRIDLIRTDGKKLKLDLVTPLDAETEKFNGPGVAKARVDLAGYKGHRFEFDAGAHGSFEFWNHGTATLREGFTLGWRPDLAKDPDGKGRLVLEVR